MQLVKTFLEEKFSKVLPDTPGAGVNKVLRYKDDNTLEAVDITNAGLKPQIYLLNNTSSDWSVTPTCTYGGTSITVEPDAQLDRAYFFNVPGPSASTPSRTYTLRYVKGSTAYTSTVTVTEYKQYSVIINN